MTNQIPVSKVFALVDDDDYEVEGGLQKRKDKQKRGYEPVESVNERKNPKRE